MSGRVPDASALGAIAFGEDRAAEARRALHGKELVAPPLLFFELANIAWKKASRDPEAVPAVLQGFIWARSLEIGIVDVDLMRVLEIALDMRSTVYDASYLWVAREAGATLVSFDERLRAAARAARVPLAPRDR
ncbi:MAG: type II toxin-antitoxin system VapC family toxin [Acidithiobacillales bacterium]